MNHDDQIAETNARLERVQREALKDEAKLRERLASKRSPPTMNDPLPQSGYCLVGTSKTLVSLKPDHYDKIVCSYGITEVRSLTLVPVDLPGVPDRHLYLVLATNLAQWILDRSEKPEERTSSPSPT